MEQNKNIGSDEILGKNLDFKTDSSKNYRLLGMSQIRLRENYPHEWEHVRDRNQFHSRELLGGAAIVGISGLSAIIAGLVTSHIAKKKNQDLLRELGKDVAPAIHLESPYSLALRALAWGTVWAVGGCSLIAFGIWKWYGFKDLEDLRTRLRSHIKKSPPDERTEFASVRDFLNYLNEESKKKST